MQTRANETVIVGGGPAGAALSIMLAESGREVMLIEKSSAAHDKVCGEFLSGEAILYLQLLGLDVFALGARKIGSIRMGFSSGFAESTLPFPAASLSRKCLDEALIQRARALGATVLRGRRVHGVEKFGSGTWAVRFDDGECLSSKALFLATGKHDLHNWERSCSRSNDLVAFKMHWRLSPEQTEVLDEAVELFFFPGGYAGLQLIEKEAANLCLLIQAKVLRSLGGRWESVLGFIEGAGPQLRTRLSGAQAQWPKPLALSAIPYGYRRKQSTGAWHLGDQAAVIPSFTGDGMSLALHSALLAGSLFISGESAEHFQPILARQLSYPVRLSSFLSQTLRTRFGRRAMEMAVTCWPSLLKVAGNETRIGHKQRFSSLSQKLC